MKVDNLLGPYLYQHKKLSLPGIGLFTLDEKAVLPDDNAKIKIPIEGISFAGKTGPQLDDSLIQYIKEETGKMKALAEADLYSFIATAFQFLNIGKPFYFEGIGTLQKNKDGAYTFTAGTVIPQKTEEVPARYSDTSRKSTYNNEPETTRGSSFNAGKLLVVSGLLITMALIGWGGYYLYNKNTNEPLQNEAKHAATQDTTTVTAAVIPDATGKKPDTTNSNLKKDSIAAVVSIKKDSTATAPTGGYKFVLESTTKKARALKRYDQLKDITMLKSYNNKISIETKDSLSFKIYTIVPCPSTDTTHVKELLNAWYYGKKEMKVKLDQ
ncbi:MAG: hypothetical protein ABJB86_06355 [Bacteroidota bacterium]